MSYTPNIPLSNERISNTQQPIRDNFFYANQYFGTDHFEFDAASDNGKHKQVTLPDRLGSEPTPGASEFAIFGLTSSAITRPYWRSDGGVTNFPLMPIKAFCIIDGTSGATIGTTFNISSVLRTDVGRYTVTLANNIVANANFGVLMTGSSTTPAKCVFTYTTSYLAPNGIITIQSIIPPAVDFVDPNPLTVVVLQFE